MEPNHRPKPVDAAVGDGEAPGTHLSVKPPEVGATTSTPGERNTGSTSPPDTMGDFTEIVHGDNVSQQGSNKDKTTTKATSTADNTPPQAIENVQSASDLASALAAPLETASSTVVATPGERSCPSNDTASSGRVEEGSPAASDRVFPIRSVISVEPSEEISPGSEADYFGGSSSPRSRRLNFAGSAPMTPTSMAFPDLPSHGYTHHSHQGTLSGSIISRATAGPIPLFGPIASDKLDTSDKSDTPESESPLIPSSQAPTPANAADDPYLTAARFTHVMTKDGHAVITGRDGALQQCEDEPIHTPGAVQGFGLILALRITADGHLPVHYTSENSKRIVGYTPRELFRLASFTDILSQEQADNLLDHIDFIREEGADPAAHGPDVFSLSVRGPASHSKPFKLWCAVHINVARSDLVLCEFEMEDDPEYPLLSTEDTSPDDPQDTLQANPTTEELIESTEILSKPLRVLRSARRHRGGESAMQVFDIMSQVQEQLSSASDLPSFLKILVGIVKQMTGFHRIMIYQFDSSFNGKVVTELVDATQTKDLFKGLHFPASDIPKQARALYKLNKVRLLYDRELPTARIVCRTKEDFEIPLDMSHCYLRAISPIHLKYLGNMCVRSSMSLSINAFNELWGLIACHSYGPTGMRVSFPARKMCRLVAETASRNIERLSYASRLQARKLINTAPTDKNPSGYIIASSDDLLALFSADFGMLSIRGEAKMLGAVDQSQEALAMLEYLRLRKITSVMTSQDVNGDFSDLKYPPGFSLIAGLLYVPLSAHGIDFIVFFRKGVIREVKWAGNPYEKSIRQGTTGYLEPRKSFNIWRETVMGKSREWTEEQVETAAVLCLVYGKFIEVWRQKEAALQTNRLTRLLLANSAHEVRTPLNAIINYLEIALESSLDDETRDNLARSYSASKSLIYVINDLLDLTKAEEGQELVKDEAFNLSKCVEDATEAFWVDAERRNIQYDVVQHPGLPTLVVGDQRRVRQAISNVASNAFQNTQTGSVKVEVYIVELDAQIASIEIAVEDTGKGMSSGQVDAIFRQMEQVESVQDDPPPPDVEGVSDTNAQSVEEDGKEHEKTLGLGLAFVARMVRTMNGQLRVKSEEGKGSRFVVRLPFDMPQKTAEGEVKDSGSGLRTLFSAPEAGNLAIAHGEVTLISAAPEKDDVVSVGVSSRPGSAARTRSTQNYCQNYGQTKDVDRLIAEISTPLSLEPDNPLHRTKSHTPPTHLGNILPPDRSLSSPPLGAEFVTDAKTPLRPVRVGDGDEYFTQPAGFLSSQAQPFFNRPATMSLNPSALKTVDPEPAPSLPFKPAPSPSPRPTPTTTTATTPMDPPTTTAATTPMDHPCLQVLVAEDDPINMKILRKRLEKAGHHVHGTVNGQDCAVAYQERRPIHSERSEDGFDVVLMDMQMPILDGLGSTKIIRAFEQEKEAEKELGGRIPIIAVSASLLEKDRETYVEAGFDGWILKPIDFKRLSTLLVGIRDDRVRESCVYVAGEWERGGWFSERRPTSIVGGGEVGEPRW